MQAIMDQIHALIETLRQALPMKPEYQAKLDKKLRLEFNYNSNHMEGNTLTYGETELLIIFGQTDSPHDIREYEEMSAHDVALQYIKEWAQDHTQPLTEAQIKNLNQTILVRPFYKEAITFDGQNTRRKISIGDYKKHPNSVLLSNGAMFEYASVTDTPILMGELVQWYRNSEEQNMHPVQIAAELHYKFVRIHPFDDGNGRIARLLMNYVLFKHDLPPVIIKSTEKKQYLNALNRADAGDLNAFTKYIAQQLLWSIELSIKAANGENIEEPDDLEKEITVWKKNVVGKHTPILQKNAALIDDLYQNSIRSLFEKFIEKHEQFYDLFNQRTTALRLKFISDHSHSIEIGGINDVNTYVSKNYRIENKMYASAIHGCVSFGIAILFDHYKYDTSLFNISSWLGVQLDHFKFTLEYAGKKLEKKYGKQLTTEEQNEIISECIKAVFKQIKSNTENPENTNL